MRSNIIQLIALILIFFIITPTASVAAEQTRYIHIMVALADNKSQGIFPIPQLIGNGDDARNNLYWGALYGFKTQFKKNKNWQLLKSIQAPNTDILERVIFYHKKYNTYLVGDAYKGTSIKAATKQFLIASSAGQSEPIVHENKSIKTYGQADLVGYVGHNGLMDFSLAKDMIPASKVGRDAIILACKSKQYFTNWFEHTGANALLLTTGNMAPEAYTLEAAIDGWMRKEPNKTIKELSAKAYSKYQKTGIKGARRLFFTSTE